MQTVPMDEQLDDVTELKALVHYTSVLSDQTNLRVVGALMLGERTPADLAELSRLKPAHLSRLLDRLRWLGLVRQISRNERTFYKIDENGLRRFARAAQSVSKETFPQREKGSVALEEGEEWERKVLRNFFAGERLREIPASFKAFQVVLRWLARQFEPGVRYHERDLNEMIKRYHPDCATLRRGMIDAGLMQRENNVYWLV